VEKKMFDSKYIKDTIALVRHKMNLYWASSGCHKHGNKTCPFYGGCKIIIDGLTKNMGLFHGTNRELF
jgi:hypothetical protein